MATETVQFAKCRIDLAFLITGGNGGQQQVNQSMTATFADGTSANQMTNAYVSESRTLAASSNEDLDLSGFTDFQGDAVAPTNAKVFLFKIISADAGSVLTVKAAASNGLATPFTAAGAGVKLSGPGAFFALGSPSDGYAITAGTGDLINVAAAGGSITYAVYVLVG